MGGGASEVPTWLFKTAFILANGPVACAVPVWGFSLVFHDFDKVNSTYIHVLPMLLMFTLRWHTFPSLNSLTLGDQLFALATYLLWQGLYLLITEVLLAKRLNANPNLRTSLRWLTTAPKNGMHKLVKATCRKFGVMAPNEGFDYRTRKTLAIFCLTQLLYTVLTMSITTLLFASHTWHAAFCVGVGLNGVYNGASFYIDVFATRYTRTIEERWEEYKRTPRFLKAHRISIDQATGTDKGHKKHQSCTNKDSVGGNTAGKSSRQPIQRAIGDEGCRSASKSE